MAVTVACAILEVEGRARIGEDGGCVAPIEHEVEEDTDSGGEFSWGRLVGARDAVA
jgi:hypothetical protein